MPDRWLSVTNDVVGAVVDIRCGSARLVEISITGELQLRKLGDRAKGVPSFQSQPQPSSQASPSGSSTR